MLGMRATTSPTFVGLGFTVPVVGGGGSGAGRGTSAGDSKHTVGAGSCVIGLGRQWNTCD